MDKQEVLEIAQMLPVGTHKRVQCCASDKSRVIWRDSDGMYSTCFRCNEAYRARFQPTLAELREREKRLADWTLAPISAPSDLSPDLPKHALAWLAVRSCSERMFSEWVGWSAFFGKLSMLLYWDAELDAVLFKDTAVPRPKPKYTVRYRNGAYCTPVFLQGTQYKGTLSALHMQEWKSTVIVEDVCSAARVSDAGFLCMAIIGTHSDINIVARALALSTDEIVIWLDGDAGGRKGTRKLQRQLELTGKDVRVVQTPRDPKCYTNKAIQELLCVN